MTKISTLAYIIKDNQVLLGLKKRGFGTGKLNGYGGKVEVESETILEGVCREVKEEAGIDVKVSENDACAKLDFWMAEDLVFVCYVFLVHQWSNEPIETDEMQPHWFPISELPLAQMWIDDPYWLPQVLQGEKLSGSVYLSKDGATILRTELKAVESINIFLM